MTDDPGQPGSGAGPAPAAVSGLPAGRMTVGFKTSPQDVSWTTLDETWAAAGEESSLSAGWLNDHLTDPNVDAGGSSIEALTLVTALAHRLPGRWLGHAVLSNTFRHPAVLAKAVTLLDHVTAGHFILGLGAGWHEDEHAAYGLTLPPIGERIARLESAVRVVQALNSPAAATPPGVSLDDRFYPLRNALNLPPPVTPGGPPIWLGGQGPRGLRMAARYASGWLLPAIPEFDLPYFSERRDAILAEVAALGRDPAGFSFVAQVPTGRDGAGLARARELAAGYIGGGASHVILGLVAGLGPDRLRLVAREVAEPLLDQFG
jgi:alkanesulfonate monooxygenase SsuD/methylene tetrahydromethanopterin reductase-like flavin-dependent oxidoreductase (luciferase family)